MLRDGVRNRAFHRALKARVTSASWVLDIGAGVGVWAIAAARLGARRVVAVEADEFLAGLITRLARDAGVGDRVEVVTGVSTQVDLAREFDVVVSETIGYDGFEEQIVPVMADAQSRFLRPGGHIVPERVALFASGAHLTTIAQPTPQGLPFLLPHFAELGLHAPRRVKRARDLQILTEPICLIDIDLSRPPLPSVLEDLRATWAAVDAAAINCVAVWVEAQLSPGVRLSTRRTSSWTPVIYPIQPTPRADSTLDFQLCLAGRREWRTTVSAGGAVASQTRSPILGGRRLLGLEDA